MNRIQQVLPWLFATCAVALGTSIALFDDLVDPAWRAIVLVVGATAAYIGRQVGRLPLVYVIAFSVSTVWVATMHLGPPPAPLDGINWTTSLLDAGIGLALIWVVTVALRSRRGSLSRVDLIDGAMVALGSALVAWVLVANPLVTEFDVDPALALASALFLPISAMLVTFMADLLLSGLATNRTMQFGLVAAILNLAGTLCASLSTVGALGDTLPVALGLHVSSFCALAAGFTHRDAPLALARLDDDDVRRVLPPIRLILMATSLMAPIALIASVAPTSTTDVIVRTVGMLVLIVAVVVRLFLALDANARAQAALRQQLHRDELTDLPNRVRFVDCVADVLDNTWRSDRHPTVLQLNIDRFKNINDSLGRADADQVLVVFANRLNEAATRFDGLVARVGGDDFLVLDGSTSSTADAMARVEMIREAFSTPITIRESSIFVTASIGVAVAPRNRTLAAEELLRRADIATHRAKADGRNRVALFDESMQAHLAHRMDVEHALHGAIGRQEMRLYHQPIVDIGTGRVTGFEALLRWQRNDGQLVSPGDFIPIAEETGVICELGAWALREALSTVRGWIDDGVVPPTTTISVNVSPRQIADPNFSDVVRDAIERSGLSPHLLWLEMTETMMLDEPDNAQRTLRQVRSMGVRLALDDFGTGYSSLSLLRQFPIQRIKIDRAFVQGIAERSNDRSLVRTIVAMARSMGLDLVAEGVETVQQLQALQQLGCDQAQGFLISHPVPADAMRSTMVALDELTELSLFGSDDPRDSLGAPSGRMPAAVGSVFTSAATSIPLGHPRL